ncbi:MAG: hypothetical protein COT73_00615 [Bdellovibrio sp. CG10_big_fil_rev_8_21_14_0_10_47_8]|nr:MAG: hypothetical protein COT73_00615 [Bdellovibrio sp. CG10_big_fil_rev_8_21_14_0_10_47_8]
MKLALNWKAEPQFGGFYEASFSGLFKKHQLDVTLQEGGSGTPTIQMLASGQVDYAVVSADEIVLSRDRGAPEVVALFAVYQTNPAGIMTHENQKFKKLEDVFRNEGTLMWQSGLPYAQYLAKKYAPLKVHSVPYLGGIGPFLKDPKSSQQCFVTSEPLAAQKAGAKVKTFLVSDSGYNPYTTVLAVRASRLKKYPEEASSMVQAVREGWRAYLADPKASNQKMAGINKAMDAKTFAASAKAQKPLIEPTASPGQGLSSDQGLGQMSKERWETLVQQMLELKLIRQKISASSLFKDL